MSTENVQTHVYTAHAVLDAPPCCMLLQLPRVTTECRRGGRGPQKLDGEGTRGPRIRLDQCGQRQPLLVTREQQYLRLACSRCFHVNQPSQVPRYLRTGRFDNISDAPFNLRLALFNYGCLSHLPTYSCLYFRTRKIFAFIVLRNYEILQYSRTYEIIGSYWRFYLKVSVGCVFFCSAGRKNKHG